MALVLEKEEERERREKEAEEKKRVLAVEKAKVSWLFGSKQRQRKSGEQHVQQAAVLKQLSQLQVSFFPQNTFFFF